MNAQIIPFDFNSQTVRVLGEDPEKPLFVAQDIAKILGYKRPKDAIRRFCVGASKRRPIIDRLGRAQNMRVIHEPDVYRLIFGSNLPEATSFQNWVFEEVLPSIRKTGRYGSAPSTLTPAQQRHIQNRVAYLGDTQVLTPYEAIMASLEKQFNVESFRDIPADQYPAVCRWLKCEPEYEHEVDEAQLLVDALKKQNAVPLREIFASPMTSRLFLVIRDGKLALVKDLSGYSIVRADGYKKVSQNIHRLQEQLQWLEGRRDDDVLELEMISLH